MNKTLDLILKKYGVEEVIGGILEQLRVLVETEDRKVAKAVKDAVRDYSCDTEYIFNLCELGRCLTFVSDNPLVSDDEWKHPQDKLEFIKEMEEASKLDSKRLIYLNNNGTVFVDFSGRKNKGGI